MFREPWRRCQCGRLTTSTGHVLIALATPAAICWADTMGVVKASVAARHLPACDAVVHARLSVDERPALPGGAFPIEPSSRITIGINTAISSRRLARSVIIRSLCRARNARSIASAICRSLARGREGNPAASAPSSKPSYKPAPARGGKYRPPVGTDDFVSLVERRLGRSLRPRKPGSKPHAVRQAAVRNSNWRNRYGAAVIPGIRSSVVSEISRVDAWPPQQRLSMLGGRTLWRRERVAQRPPDAGGDCHCAGGGPEGDGWRVAVEDPSGGARPVAVLALVDRGCATSSIRLRRWRAGGTEAHHLIDPATGRPGGAGLAAVTVVATDACVAEVTAKDLFLHGADGIGPAADRAGTAALWVATDGRVAASPAMEPHVVWWGS